MSRPNVRLRIEDLVLEGFSPAEGARIGAAVERELERLIAERGLPEGMSGAAIPRIDGGSFRVSAGSRPESAGREIAARLYDSFGAASAQGGERR